MARTARIVVAGHPHHVVHRGHNRQAVFGAGDEVEYLNDLRTCAQKYGIGVLAYCLMPNHVHLLLVPQEPDALARAMHRVAARHAQRVNRRCGRTGALWQGRFYSSVVDSDAYLLVCVRYIELNPVRAHLASEALAFPWSSAGERCGLRAASGLLGGRSEYLQDLPTGAGAYACFLDSGTQADYAVVRSAVRTGKPTGSAAFVEATLANAAKRFAAVGGPVPAQRKVNPSPAGEM